MATGIAAAAPLAGRYIDSEPAGDGLDAADAGLVDVADDELVGPGDAVVGCNAADAESVGAVGGGLAVTDGVRAGPVEPVDEAGWQDGAAVPSRCNHASAAVEAS